MSLGGDAKQWRDIGHAKWYDPYAVLEDTNSKEFKALVKHSAALWAKATKPLTKRIRERIGDIENNQTPRNPEHAHESYGWNGLTIRIQHDAGHTMNIWFQDTKGTILHTFHNVTNFATDPVSNIYAVIHDIGKGAETLELNVFNLEHKKPLWKEAPVGPDIAFQADYILYLSVENQLRYPKLFRAKKHNGHANTVLYHEKDKRFQVELHDTCDGPILRIHNAIVEQGIGIVRGTEIEWIRGKGTHIPIGYTIYGTDRHLIVNNKSYELPTNQYLEDARKIRNDIFVTTVQNGCTSLYFFDLLDRHFVAIYESKTPNEIELHKYTTNPTIRFSQPNKPAELYEITDSRLNLQFRFPEYVTLPHVSSGFAKSKDGTQVPYTYVTHTKNPTKLIVEGYGSYGISAHRSYPIRWLPWLAKGYALAVAMPRGGRENGDTWYNGGRTAQRKQNTFDDTAAVIATVQHKYDISPQRTVFYGRSAGGLLAANIALQYPESIGAIYAEVPYLDVLRTTTNPQLPLTQMEYDEFGDPIHKPADYKAVRDISPVDTVTEAPKNAPFILVRTALHDTQVLPYEAMKWTERMKSHGWNILLGIDEDGGHFTETSILEKLQAEDAILIDSHVSTIPARTRKLRSHVSKGTKRRRMSSRKH